MQSCAYTFCKLGLLSPQKVSTLLKEVIDPICKNLRSMPERHDKEEIYKGLVAMCNANPDAVLPYFNSFCDTVANYFQPSDIILNIFGTLLHNFKNGFGNRWDSIFNKFNQKTKEKLKSIYKL